MSGYLRRLADPYLDELFTGLPVVSVTGPRACGKTTSASRLAANVIHLDDPVVGGLFAASPDAALAEVTEPALLDEWQAVPSVLGAIKRTVDTSRDVGRFLLTGSADVGVTTPQWAGTGRVVDVPLFGLTQREILGRVDGRLFVDRLLDASLDVLTPGEPMSSAPTVVDYLRLALIGGFPDSILATSASIRRSWLEAYVAHLLQRDVFLLGGRPDQQRLAAYMTAIASNTASVIDTQTLCTAAGVTRVTAIRYQQTLQRLYILDLVPAWWTSRLSRLRQAPKRYVTDPALAAAVLGLDLDGVMRDVHVVGALLDTYVAAQLRGELAASQSRPRMHHLRDQSGRHEIDILLEYPAGRVVGLEVKVAGHVDLGDAKHLVWLKDQLGDDFVCGVVLHTGPGSYRLADRVFAVPISTIWA
ncbi:MAG: DUF4143 domain-containing protein [Propionibacteriaceae bacterium]|nr:DUF4143 domain-containing protein [Propionibacteriaceae bacterium]